MPELYGLVQMPDVMKIVESSTSVKRRSLTQAIYNLQQNPRPHGHESAEDFGTGYARVIVAELVPPYIVIYQIDEEHKRVLVIAVYEQKWN